MRRASGDNTQLKYGDSGGGGNLRKIAETQKITAVMVKQGRKVGSHRSLHVHVVERGCPTFGIWRTLSLLGHSVQSLP